MRFVCIYLLTLCKTCLLGSMLDLPIFVVVSSSFWDYCNSYYHLVVIFIILSFIERDYWQKFFTLYYSAKLSTSKQWKMPKFIRILNMGSFIFFITWSTIFKTKFQMHQTNFRTAACSGISLHLKKCMASITAWKVSLFGVFLVLNSGIRTEYGERYVEYGEILPISLSSVRMREVMDQKNSKYGPFSRSVPYRRQLSYHQMIYSLCRIICWLLSRQKQLM